MANDLAIDPDLLDRAVAVSGERTKTAAVTRALEEFIARRGRGVEGPSLINRSPGDHSGQV